MAAILIILIPLSERLKAIRSNHEGGPKALLVNDLRAAGAIVRFDSLADIAATRLNVRFTPESGHSMATLQCPLSANSGRYTAY
jgi:hypothetical protein